MDTPATPPPVRHLSHIPVLFRDQRTQQNMTTMVVKRCGFCAIRSARPDRSFPWSRPTKTPTTGGMISHSRFHFPRVPTHVVLTHRRRSVTNVARAPPTAPGRGQQKRPVATPGADMKQHRLAACVRYGPHPHNRDQRRTAAFSRTLLTNEHRRVGKQTRIRMFYSKFEFSNFV